MIPFLGIDDKFPNVENALEDGLLAAGADLSVNRLLNAYQNGIFPWYSKGEPILWWSPDPRFVLIPSDIHISKSMKKLINQEKYKVVFNQNFHAVIQNCQEIKRKAQDGTWIDEDMIKAYINLHKKGYAHSVEVYSRDNQLVGGLYGVSFGKCFFGESMFSLEPNCSKLALIHLAKTCKALDFDLIDCQVYTAHLKSMGAKMISRNQFCAILENNSVKKVCF